MLESIQVGMTDMIVDKGVTHTPTHSLSLTHFLTHTPTHSLTHPHTHSLTHSPTHSLSLTHSLTNVSSPTQLGVTHSITHSLSLTHSPTLVLQPNLESLLGTSEIKIKQVISSHTVQAQYKLSTSSVLTQY